MSLVALQYGNSVAVVDDSQLNILQPPDVFPNFAFQPGQIGWTLQNAVNAGVITESTAPEAVANAQSAVTTQNASTIVSQIQKGAVQITDNPSNQGILNNMVQTLVSAGIDQSDAQAIVQMGVSPAQTQTGAIGTQLSQPLDTGQSASNALNTGQAGLAINNLLAQVPKAPISIVPSGPDWMNWLILLALAFIALWIVVEVF